MGVLRVPGPSVTLLAACRQESPACAHGTGRHPSHGTDRPLGVRGPSGDRGPGSPCSGGGKLADSRIPSSRAVFLRPGLVSALSFTVKAFLALSWTARPSLTPATADQLCGF